MADPRLKQITIKTGVVKRLTKEKTVYEREAEAQKNRVEKIKRDGQDEHVIRKQEEVLQESLMMLPDCQRRLVKAYDDLNELLKNEEELKATKEYENALSVLNDAKSLISPEGLAQLRQNVERVKTRQQELDEHEWTVKISDIVRQKQEISNKIQNYSGTGTNLLKKIQDLLKRRKKKRDRIRRMNARLKIERNNAQINREKLHKICDDWVKQKTEKDLEQKRTKEAAERSEIVLYSVNKRITSAERYLHLFEMIIKLRKSRYHANPRTDNNERDFLEKLKRLESVWSDSLLAYKEEKIKLQAFLNESSKSLEHQWREVLFGEGFQDKTQNLEARSLQEFIEIRRTWDSYITPADCAIGSSIPVGWITPNENPLEQWRQYRSK